MREDAISCVQIRKRKSRRQGLPEELEAIIFSADCRAKQLCQENVSVKLALIVTTMEDIVQSLIEELTRGQRGGTMLPQVTMKTSKEIQSASPQRVQALVSL